jgi:hypothetical protein
VPDATGIFQKVAADGSVSATFPGGVELTPRTLFQIPENVPTRQIRWVERTAGLVAYIDDMYDSIIGNTLTLRSYALPKSSIQLLVGNQNVNLLASDGTSDFGTVIYDSTYTGGPTYIPAGNTELGGITVNPGNTPTTYIVSLTGYVIHNGANVAYNYNFYASTTSPAYNLPILAGNMRTPGDYNSASALAILPARTGSNRISVIYTASAYPAIGLYGWRAVIYRIFGG